MKSITMTSIYGKTLRFSDYNSGSDSRIGAINVIYSDDDGRFSRGMVFAKDQVDALRSALAEPVTPVAKPDEGIFFMLRQKKSKPVKVKVCFPGQTHTKEYTSRSKAEEDAKRLCEQYPEWNYFIVEKEGK